MNREQRRAFNKKNHTKYTYDEFEAMIMLNRLKNGEDIDVSGLSKMGKFVHMDNLELAPDGSIARLNYNEILKRPQADLTDEFKQWIEDNKDKEFHITREGVSDSLVAFEEDLRDVELDGVVVKKPKWLFDLYSDLLIKKGDTFKSLFDLMNDEKVEENTEEK